MEAVIGSRTIKYFDFSKLKLTNVISGGALGIDSAVRLYCMGKGIPLTEIKPIYSSFGRSAPIIRNKEIVQKADLIYAIWDRKSKGTKFVIDYALKIGKKVVVIEQTL